MGKAQNTDEGISVLSKVENNHLEGVKLTAGGSDVREVTAEAARDGVTRFPTAERFILHHRSGFTADLAPPCEQ